MGLDIGTVAGFLDLDTGPFDKALAGAEGKFGGISAGAVAAGAMAGALLAKGISDTLNIEQANDKLAAQLGLTAQESERYGNIAGSLYADAYGSSIEEVNTALGAVSSSLGDSLGGSDAALQEATGHAMDLAQAFGIDVADAAAMAGFAIRTGLADNSEQAFDLITASMQQMPAAMRGELIPMIEEYGVHLAAVGITGEDAFGLLVAASQEGSYAIDKTADSLKEFAIRATDGSVTTREAYRAIGVDADEMAARIVEGGDSARGALNQIIEGLLAMEDPVARQQEAIKLFGAPLEDLSVTQVPQFLQSILDAGEGMQDTEGAADSLGATLADNLGTKLTAVKRKAEMFLVDFLSSPFGPWVLGAAALVGGLVALGGIATTAADKLRGIKDSWSDMGSFGKISVATTAVAGFVGALIAWDAAKGEEQAKETAESFVAMGTDIEASFIQFMSTWGGQAAGGQIFDQLIESNIEAATRFVDTAEQAGWASDEIASMRDRIEQKSTADAQGRNDADAYNAAVDDQAAAMEGAAGATELSTEAIKEQADAMRAASDPLFALNDAIRSHEEAQTGVAEAEQAAADARSAHGAGSLEAMAAERDLADARIAAGESAFGLRDAEMQLAAAIAENPSLLGDVNDMLAEFVATGAITMEEAGVLAERFGLLGERVEGVPDEQSTDVSAPGADGVITHMDWLRGKVLAVPDSSRTNTSAPGARTASDQLDGVARAVGRIDKDVQINVRTKQWGPIVGKMHDGGLVEGPLGAEVPKILQAGERVLAIDDPLNKAIAAAEAGVDPRVDAASITGFGGASRGGAGGGRIRIDVAGGDDMFMRWLRDRITVEGGDVQQVLGR